jgi:hypothetical protein
MADKGGTELLVVPGSDTRGQYYRAMEAFSRQHAKMDGESEIFWLAEAVLAKLGADAHKLRVMLHPKMKEEKPRIVAHGRCQV